MNALAKGVRARAKGVRAGWVCEGICERGEGGALIGVRAHAKVVRAIVTEMTHVRRVRAYMNWVRAHVWGLDWFKCCTAVYQARAHKRDDTVEPTSQAVALRRMAQSGGAMEQRHRYIGWGWLENAGCVGG